MQAFEHALKILLEKLPSAPSKSALDQLVAETLADVQHKASAENWKTHWEYVLRAAVFDVAVRV